MLWCWHRRIGVLSACFMDDGGRGVVVVLMVFVVELLVAVVMAVA